MNAKSILICAGICGAMTFAAATMSAEIGTRSTDEAYADLMRTWKSPGGQSAGSIKTRSAAASYADMMRDWDGSLARSAGTIVGVSDIAVPVLTGGDRSMQAAGFGRR